jgi:alkanesulfonate monooxygenase SsuD/methylene tetrahydromethanopterin reductase-like flavin-dependent oxidoreductase (luciferase family)
LRAPTIQGKGAVVSALVLGGSSEQTMAMRCGVVMYGGIGPREIADVAREAEQGGWDGFFVWDAFLSDNAWVLLAAAAMLTERLRLGTMLTAPSRRRPWQLASEVATLDRLSRGRAVLALGLGAAEDLGFARVGEATDRRVRAELLDESIDILTGMWSGQVFSYQGKHYQVRDARMAPAPVQSPRVPLWVVGAWPRPRSMRRVLRCDGVIPTRMTPEGAHVDVLPNDIRAIKAFVEERRTSATPFDIVVEGDTPAGDRASAAAAVGPFADAGATWWLESLAVHAKRGGLGAVRERLRQGPPAGA